MMRVSQPGSGEVWGSSGLGLEHAEDGAWGGEDDAAAGIEGGLVADGVADLGAEACMGEVGDVSREAAAGDASGFDDEGAGGASGVPCAPDGEACGLAGARGCADDEAPRRVGLSRSLKVVVQGVDGERGEDGWHGLGAQGVRRWRRVASRRLRGA
jgi:hypothetical protein